MNPLKNGKNLKIKNMKNILITGGAGFIGSNLALRLIKEGYKVTVLDNLSTQIHGEKPEMDSPLYQSIIEKVNFIKGDVCRREDWLKVIENQDCIFHFAAETGTGQSMYEIEKYVRVNTYGTALMMDVLVNTPNSVKKIILSSSRAVYGEGKYQNNQGEIVYPNSRLAEDMKKGVFELLDENKKALTPLPTDENSKLHPVSIYGTTKLQQEEILKQAAESNDKDYVILRFQNVYGVGQSLRNPYTGIISIFSNQISNQETINIFEDGCPVRDFIEVSDVVEACVKAMTNEKANREILNIGTGVPTTVLEVAQLLNSLFRTQTKIEVSGAFRLGDIRYNVADLTKTNNTLNFEVKVELKEGLERFVKWVSQQKLEPLSFQKSLDELSQKGLLFKS